MPGSGLRRGLELAGVFGVAVLVAACSGGAARVATSPTTRPSATDSSHSSTTVAGQGSAAKARKTAAAKTRGSVRTGKGSGKVGSVGVGSAVVTQPGSTSPDTVATVTVTSPAHRVGSGAAGPPPTTTPTTLPGPKPYDPSKPIDLGGEPGVTPAEQARAEQLVRDTLRDLPKYADYHVAVAAGYRSIEDGFTGTEHFVNWSYVNDGHILDSKYPESLVYQFPNGVETLVSAMYMMPFGTRFTDVPDVGGPLTQWHVHNNLCLVDNPSDPLQKVVALPSGGSCPPGSVSAGGSPMLHVWIVANPCGPFAALEGIGAGDPPPGETRLCDSGHGSS